MEIQITDACCNSPATKTAWVKKGTFKPLSKQVAGIERRTYRTGPISSKLGIVSLIDIHGFHPTTVQFLDVSKCILFSDAFKRRSFFLMP